MENKLKLQVLYRVYYEDLPTVQLLWLSTAGPCNAQPAMGLNLSSVNDVPSPTNC